MKRRHLCELVPPWSDGKVQLVLALLGLGVGVLSSLYCYLSQLETAWGSLSYLGSQGEVHWTAMTDFADLVGSQGAVSNWFSRPAFFAFPLLMLAGLALAGYNWACFRRGSRSIYLMRRLPDRWELARRCLTIPLVLILGAVVLTAALLACTMPFISGEPRPNACGRDSWKSSGSILAISSTPLPNISCPDRQQNGG